MNKLNPSYKRCVKTLPQEEKQKGNLGCMESWLHILYTRNGIIDKVGKALQ